MNIDALMAELLETRSYDVEPDWRDAPELGEERDEEPRALGGPGSGNFGHAGRPGQVGGSAPASEGFRLSDVSTTVTGTLERNLLVLKGAAKRLDFPLEKVVIKDYDKRFFVGDRQFSEGGHYNAATGEIIFSKRSLSNTSALGAEGMFAHEVMHRDWNDVADALGLRPGPPGLAAEDADKLPGAGEIHDLFADEAEALATDDGITPYSKAYWHAALADRDSYDFEDKLDRATNETLAEISKRDVYRAFGSHPPDHYDPTPRWRKLHTAVKEAAKAIRTQHWLKI